MTLLDELRATALLLPVDLHFARTLLRIAGEEDETMALAAALLSRHLRQGHVCLDLERIDREGLSLHDDDGNAIAGLSLPTTGELLQALEASSLVGEDEVATPLVLDAQRRLYLRRLWAQQRSLALAIRQRAESEAYAWPEQELDAALDRLFPGSSNSEPTTSGAAGAGKPDRQRQAVERAARYGFSVISGGPGTGKTFTVVKILALLVEASLRRGAPAPRIRLAAPTGKAAARLVESIRNAKSKLNAGPAVLEAIVEEASTLHRLLGATGGATTHYRRNRLSPIVADIIIVDEASMVDLSLMARLFDASRPATRLILLGDKDQLASVEAGSVLGDIASLGASSGDRAEAAESSALARAITILDKSYRFHGGIAKVAEAIRQIDDRSTSSRERGVERVIAMLREGRHDDIRLVELGEGNAAYEALRAPILEGLRALFEVEGDAERLAHLDRFRILCAHRRGRLGVEGINEFVTRALLDEGWLQIGDEPLLGGEPPTGFYAGRPVLITHNDYELGLYNGDLGITVPLDRGAFQVLFPTAEGKARTIAVSRLPAHETAFAMSVHKSQGSEVDEIAVLLPERPSPVLCRELLYTAITRAKKHVVVYGSEAIVRHALTTRIVRDSGLRDAIIRK